MQAKEDDCRTSSVADFNCHDIENIVKTGELPDVKGKQPKIWGIVPAAGFGSRMKAPVPKQYLLLAGEPVLVHTLRRLCAVNCIDGVVIGIRQKDDFWERCRFDHDKLIGIANGGAERADTVLNAIHFLVQSHVAAPGDWVLVHDAVRPCVRQDDIQKLVNCLTENPDGALLGIPVHDTLKKSNRDNKITETVPRESYWRAVTPQIFPLGPLRQALESCIAQNQAVFDESCAMEYMGRRPQLIESHSTNIKITLESDLRTAEAIISGATT